MWQILAIIVSAILTGAGFLTYRHPLFIRRLSIYLLLILTTVYCIIIAYYKGTIHEAITAQQIITNTRVPLPKILDSDSSTFSIDNPLDRVAYMRHMLKDKEKELSVILFMEQTGEDMKSQMTAKIDQEKLAALKSITSLHLYCGGIFFILLVMHLLSYPFHKFQNNTTKKPNVKPPKTSLKKRS